MARTDWHLGQAGEGMIVLSTAWAIQALRQMGLCDEAAAKAYDPLVVELSRLTVANFSLRSRLRDELARRDKVIAQAKDEIRELTVRGNADCRDLVLLLLQLLAQGELSKQAVMAITEAGWPLRRMAMSRQPDGSYGGIGRLAEREAPKEKP